MSSNKKNSGGKKALELGPTPYLLIVCGLPGSGKSTVSKELEPFGWVRVNQDDLGSAEDCKKIMEKALKHCKSVIIDRCNVHAKERKMWMQEAKKYTNQMEVLFLDVPMEECIRRVRERINHPTLDGENAEVVIRDFQKRLEEPQKWEGFGKIMISTSSDETNQYIKELSAYDISKKKFIV